MHEAVFKNSFRDGGYAFCEREHRHELRLHICREIRVWLGGDICAMQLAWAAHHQPVIRFADDNAGLGKFLNHRCHVTSAGTNKLNLAFGDGGGAGKATSFDTVSNDFVSCGM